MKKSAAQPFISAFITIMLILLVFVVSPSCVALDTFSESQTNETPDLEAQIFVKEERTLPLLPAENGEIKIELFDSATKQPIKDAHVLVELIDKSNKRYKTIMFTGESNILSLPYQKNIVAMRLIADFLDTEGSDYYGQLNEISINGDSFKAYLVPAGSVIGRVSDRNDNAVSGAKISFLCGGEYDIEPTYTDDFGNFKATLPQGNCRISASSSKRSGFTDMQILQGTQARVDIKLHTKIAGSNSLFIFLIIAVVLILLIFLAVKKFRKFSSSENKFSEAFSKPQKPETFVEHKEDTSMQILIGKRARDIMSTLSPKEKEIVELLLMHKSLTQAKISWKTGTPKTTLARQLEMLQRKKIVDIEQEGKLKKIKLTDWFLEKD